MADKKDYPSLDGMKNELNFRALQLGELKKKIKNNHKALSASMKKDSSSREHRASYLENCSTLEEQYAKDRHNYRHLHVAYCELRGRSRLRIEPKSPWAKELDEIFISTIKKKFAPAE
ncbi:MAG: hypothetical protein NTY80_02255 [candidate division SR1 bacterium]|nr:hypothetical protein [candidate division SR1 bacterium]